MPLQSSGAISLNDMHVEAGGTTGTQVSVNDSDIRDLISKGSGAQSSFSEFYGASSGPTSYEVNGGNYSYYNSKYDRITIEVSFTRNNSTLAARDKWIDPFIHGGNANPNLPAGTYKAEYAEFIVSNNAVFQAGTAYFDHGNFNRYGFPLYNNDANPVSFDSFWNHCYLKFENSTIATWNRADIRTKNNSNHSSLGFL